MGSREQFQDRGISSCIGRKFSARYMVERTDISHKGISQQPIVAQQEYHDFNHKSKTLPRHLGTRRAGLIMHNAVISSTSRTVLSPLAPLSSSPPPSQLSGAYFNSSTCMRLSRIASGLQTCRVLSTTAAMTSTPINSLRDGTSYIAKGLMPEKNTCAIDFSGVSLKDLPKSNIFTSRLPRTFPHP